jgi:DNA repair protein RadA/Sms
LNTLPASQKALYVSGEESESQLKMRAERLGVRSDELLLLADTNLSNVLFHAEKTAPNLLIIDSIQTMYRPEITSAPGSVTQLRDCAMALMRLAKEQDVAVVLVGHVTKDGAIAGPKVLEHMVDCVLYFEGERRQSYRILRGVKNRFGSTNEIGVFEMRADGFAEAPNPSLMLLAGRPLNCAGSAVVCAMEGTRPVLAEIQALVAQSGFGTPRRMATGLDYNRCNLLIAVLEKRVGLQLQTQDAYVNVTGGLRIDDPAADLAIVCAIASSFKNAPLDPSLAVMGEIGLTGELRSVSFPEKRVAEAAGLGFDKCVVPFVNYGALKTRKIKGKKMEIYPAKNIAEALAYMF